MINGEVSNADLDRLMIDDRNIQSEFLRLYQEALRAEPLLDRQLMSQFSPIEQLQIWWTKINYKYSNDFDFDINFCAQRYHFWYRGHNVLIALRRYKNRTNQWPTDLDQISSELSVETLLDPFSDKPFIYKKLDDSFALYSRGKNGIDENGQHSFDFSKMVCIEDDRIILARPIRRGRRQLARALVNKNKLARTNVFNFRRFYLTHQKVQTSVLLGWSQYVKLLPVKI